jgi:hypothetical protein
MIDAAPISADAERTTAPAMSIGEAAIVGSAKAGAAEAENPRWRGRGVHVPKGMTRGQITKVADALMAIEGGCVAGAPWNRYEACWIATKVLEALRARPRSIST